MNNIWKLLSNQILKKTIFDLKNKINNIILLMLMILNICIDYLDTVYFGNMII